MKTMQAAQGKWLGILMHFGVDHCFLQNRHGECPVCGGRDRYRFDDKDGNGTFYCNVCGAGTGLDLLMKINGWDFKEAARRVDEIIHNVQVVEQKPKTDPLIRLRKIQSELKSIEGINPVSLYLKSRGLPICSELKYHSGIKYYNQGKFVDTYPAMVARVNSPDNSPVTFHVTYLTPQGGKAPVGAVKKIMTPAISISGAAIRLAQASEVLAVTEGIETGLAVMRDHKMPVWALLNANNMEKFMPPDSVNKIIIFADNDKSYTGQKSAYILANKLALNGLSVQVLIPKKTGADFADRATQ